MVASVMVHDGIEVGAIYPPELQQVVQEQDFERVIIDPFDIQDDGSVAESAIMSEADVDLMYETLVGMYAEDQVMFDNAAERFLRRALDLQSTAAFQGLMQKAVWVEAQIHQMCGENHAMQTALSGLTTQVHNENDGHNHAKSKTVEEHSHHTGCASKRGSKCDCSDK